MARRGRPQLLDPEHIVDAALEVLDTDGLGAVSLRRVGAELGVSHMTLYGYFPSKEALLDAMVARTIEVPATSPDPARTWDANLKAAIHEIHAALVRRPGVASVLVTQEATGEWVGQVRDKLLGLLAPAGYDAAQATDGISVLFNYLLGSVMIETSRGHGGSAEAFDMGLDMLVDGLKQRAPRI